MLLGLILQLLLEGVGGWNRMQTKLWVYENRKLLIWVKKHKVYWPVENKQRKTLTNNWYKK